MNEKAFIKHNVPSPKDTNREDQDSLLLRNAHFKRETTHQRFSLCIAKWPSQGSN